MYGGAHLTTAQVFMVPCLPRLAGTAAQCRIHSKVNDWPFFTHWIADFVFCPTSLDQSDLEMNWRAACWRSSSAGRTVAAGSVKEGREQMGEGWATGRSCSVDVLDEDTGLQRKSTSIDLEVHSVGFTVLLDVCRHMLVLCCACSMMPSSSFPSLVPVKPGLNGLVWTNFCGSWPR